MPRGRPRKPVSIAFEDGSAAVHPERYKDRARTEHKSEGIPPMPEKLGKYGKEWWERTVTLLVQKRICDEIDASLLEPLARAWDEYQRNIRHPKTNSDQFFSRRMRLLGIIEKLLSKCGLTPESRTRIAVKPAEKETKTAKHIA